MRVLFMLSRRADRLDRKRHDRPRPPRLNQLGHLAVHMIYGEHGSCIYDSAWRGAVGANNERNDRRTNCAGISSDVATSRHRVGSRQRSKRQQSDVRLPEGPLIIGGIFAVIFGANSLTHGISENSRVRVTRLEEPAPNLTNADLNLGYVRKVSAAIVAEMNKEAHQLLTASSTAIVEQKGKKFGIIRLKARGVTPVIFIVGLANGKLIKVVCSRSDGFGNPANVEIQ